MSLAGRIIPTRPRENAQSLKSLNPIFKPQAINTSKLPCVISDQCQIQSNCVSGNPKVIAPNQTTFFSKSLRIEA